MPLYSATRAALAPSTSFIVSSSIGRPICSLINLSILSLGLHNSSRVQTDGMNYSQRTLASCEILGPVEIILSFAMPGNCSWIVYDWLLPSPVLIISRRR